jgi:hypothetical protein
LFCLRHVLTVERGEGYVALKVAEKLTRAIESSGHETQAVIREGAQVPVKNCSTCG